MFVLLLIMKILLYLLIFIISLILLFVIIPFEYDLDTKIDEKISANANLKFFRKFLKVIVSYKNKETLFLIKVMGLSIISKKIKMSNKKNKMPSKENKMPSKKRKQENVKNEKSNFNIKDYVQREFLEDSINYIKAIINIAKPKAIKIHGIYGFEDPSLTGVACGIIPIVSNFIPTSDIKLQPVFDDEIIDVYCEIYGRISLLIAIIKTLKFVLKKNNRKKIFKKVKKSETY